MSCFCCNYYQDTWFALQELKVYVSYSKWVFDKQDIKHIMWGTCCVVENQSRAYWSGLHKLWYPSIRDTSTWCKFGAHGEHGDVFLFSNLGALWFSENLIRYSLHVCLREVKNSLFFLQTLLFTAFLVTVLKISTYAVVSTWSLVSSGYEHVKQLMQPCRK